MCILVYKGRGVGTVGPLPLQILMRIELKRIWQMPLELIPIITGAVGHSPKSLERNLRDVRDKGSPRTHTEESGAGSSAYSSKSGGLLK